jgi:site-specific recombinase XerD
MHSAISIRSPSSSNVNSHITYAKTEKKIPLVIDMEELVIKIDKIENKKHKAIIALTSSVGLRVSEVIKLKLSDINSKLMQIEIRGAKGKKDRLVPLTGPGNTSAVLYQYKPQVYLFNGQFGLQYSDNSCNAL